MKPTAPTPGEPCANPDCGHPKKMHHQYTRDDSLLQCDVSICDCACYVPTTQPVVPPARETEICADCGVEDTPAASMYCKVTLRKHKWKKATVPVVPPIDGEKRLCGKYSDPTEDAWYCRLAAGHDGNCSPFRPAAPPVAPIEATGETKPCWNQLPGIGNYCTLPKGHSGKCAPVSPPQPATREKPLRIPDDLKELWENGKIGAETNKGSVTGWEYQLRVNLIERIAALEDRNG